MGRTSRISQVYIRHRRVLMAESPRICVRPTAPHPDTLPTAPHPDTLSVFLSGLIFCDKLDRAVSLRR